MSTDPLAPRPAAAADPPPIDVQSLSRSCNEVLILSLLSMRPHHGYQLALELEDRSRSAFGFKHGTLYPILHKFERDGLIRGVFSSNASSESSRKRNHEASRSRAPTGP